MTYRQNMRQRSRNHLMFTVLIIFNIILFLYFYIFSLHSGDSNAKPQVPPVSWERRVQNITPRKIDNADTDIKFAKTDFNRTHELKGNKQTKVDPLSKPLISMHSSTLPRTDQGPRKYRLEDVHADVDKEKFSTAEKFNGGPADVDLDLNGEPRTDKDDELLTDDGHEFPDVDINKIPTVRDKVANVGVRESADQENQKNMLGISEKPRARIDEASIFNADINKKLTAPKYWGNIPNFGTSRESVGQDNKLKIPDQIKESVAQKNVNIPNIGWNNNPSIPNDVNKGLTAPKYRGNIPNFGTSTGSVSQENKPNIPDQIRESVAQKNVNIPNIGWNNNPLVPKDINEELTAPKYMGNISNFISRGSVGQENKPNITVNKIDGSIAQKNVNIPNIDWNNNPSIPNDMKQELTAPKFGNISYMSINKGPVAQDLQAKISNISVNTSSAVNNQAIIPNSSAVGSNQITPNLSMNKVSTVQNNDVPNISVDKKSTVENNQANIPVSMNRDLSTQNKVNIPNSNIQSTVPKYTENASHFDIKKPTDAAVKGDIPKVGMINERTAEKNDAGISNLDSNKNLIGLEKNVNIVKADSGINKKYISEEEKASLAEVQRNEELIPPKDAAIIAAQEDADRIVNFI